MFRVWAFLCAARRLAISALTCVVAAVIAAGCPNRVSAQDAPIVAKSFGAVSITVGASTSLTIHIQGLDRLTGVTLTDTLPEGLVVATPNGVTGTCQGAFTTIAAASGSNNISLSGGSIEAGVGCELSLNVTAVTAGTKTNSVAATSDQGPSRPASASIMVERAATTTTIASSANPSTATQSVAFTATVTGPGGTPSGTVTFQDGSATLGTATLSAAGTATYSTSALSVGNRTLTVAYGGDATFAGSTSLALTQAVNKAPTVTTLTSSANPSAAGKSIAFTATVTGPGGTPTGTVTFQDGSANLGTATLSPTGNAVLTTSMLAVGDRSIAAAYGGDLNFTASTSSPLPQTVQPEPATVNTLQSGAILVIVIITVAFLLLVRRIAFRFVVRIFRTVFRPIIRVFRALSRRIGRILRFLRIISRAPPAKPGLAVGSVVALGGGTLARVFAGGTETDDAIAKDFDPRLVPIDRTSQIFCTWLAPMTHDRIPYDRARSDKRRAFFQ